MTAENAGKTLGSDRNGVATQTPPASSTGSPVVPEVATIAMERATELFAVVLLASSLLIS